MSAITTRERFKTGLFVGLGKGWTGFLWMMKIIIPLSLFTAVLAWSGLLETMDFFLRPVMGVFGLSPAATLPLLIGMLTGIYGGIASMAVLSLSLEEMTLVAIFLLIAHNLVQEGIIQGKSGVNPFVATIFRLVIAVVTVFVVSLLIGPSGPVHQDVVPVERAFQPFMVMVGDWARTMAALAVKIFFIIMGILTSLEMLKTFGWIQGIVTFFAPVLTFMGLSRRVGILWMTAVLFGLAYGGAVIVEEAKKGTLSKEDLEELHLSISVKASDLHPGALIVTVLHDRDSIFLHSFWPNPPLRCLHLICPTLILLH